MSCPNRNIRVWRRIIVRLACLAFLQVPTDGFIASHMKGTGESTTQMHMSATVAPDEQTKTHRGESTRLTKAKLLLKQFTEEGTDEASLSKSTASLIPGIQSRTTTSEVPDNVWSNGLLDGSDVVTRYAFRKGVKIAEPLVKYDPVAAEKLLFKQPAKW